MAGEITNGGLVATRSNCSSATAWKKLPERTSTRSATPLSSALNRVRRSAPLVDVGGDDPVGVRGQVQRLYAAPGAEVERASDRFAHGQLGERGRGRADAQHVVGGHPDGPSVQAGGQVAGHPEVEVVRGIGAYVDPGPHLTDRTLQQPRRAQRVEQTGERLLDPIHRDRRLEQPEPGERLDRAASGRREESGRGLVAREGRVGRRTQRSRDPVVGEPRPDQRLPQPPRQTGLVLVIHASHAIRRPGTGCPRTNADRAPDAR